MTDTLTNFHFLRPAWLVAVPAVVALWWLWRRQVDPLRGWRKQIEPDLLKALTVQEPNARSNSGRGLVVGWLLAAVAVAGPTWRQEPNPFAGDAAPLMILLKADVSMERPDPPPSRMERARLKIADLVELRRGEPLGLIAYAGSAHVVLPPTRDTHVVAELAAEISPEIMPAAGDRLDAALREASSILAAEQTGGSVLVIADSVDPDLSAALGEHQAVAKLPIQFLMLSDPDSSDAQSVRKAARSLGATVRPLTVDDTDVAAITRTAARQSSASLQGETSRWQEAGYWLTPVIALLVALSFRREMGATGAGVFFGVSFSRNSEISGRKRLPTPSTRTGSMEAQQ